MIIDVCFNDIGRCYGVNLHDTDNQRIPVSYIKNLSIVEGMLFLALKNFESSIYGEGTAIDSSKKE